MSAIDWNEVATEVVDILQRYVRIDTTNPAGNEVLATDFLAALLAAEGIESEVVFSAPGRANLVATLPADTVAKPLVLLNHTDVVPVESSYWHADPFGGTIKDGFLWGRGALDMKGMGVLELMTVLLLKRRGVRLRRPVRFLAVADEEAGSKYGVEWLDKNRPDLIDGAFVLNEGGYGAQTYLGVERPLFGISMSEKGPLWLNLRATGRPGHGSTPHDDNVVDRMVRALHRVQHWQRPAEITAPVAHSLQAAYDNGFLDLDPSGVAAEDVLRRYRSLAPLLTNTISATGLTTGVKHNVIPATASATLDCRLLPGFDSDRFLLELRAVIDDSRIEVETEFASTSPYSTSDTELFASIREVCASIMPEAPLLPRVTAGFTDSRTFRRRGIPAYGFVPMLLAPEEQGGMHGHNERVSLSNLRLGIEVLYKVVERVCAA